MHGRPAQDEFFLLVLGVSISNGILHRGVKVLQRLKVLHLSAFDSVRIPTGAGVAEFPKLSRQFAIGIL